MRVNLGVEMFVIPFTSKVVPILPFLNTTTNTTSNTTTAFSDALHVKSFDTVKGFPPTVLIPAVFGLYMVYYGFLAWYGEDQFKSYYNSNLNSSRYYINIISMSLISITLWMLLGLRNVVSVLPVIALIVGLNGCALIIDALIAMPKIFTCALTGTSETGASNASADSSSQKVMSCRKNNSHPKVVLSIKYFAISIFFFLASLYVITFITQIALTFTTLPPWLGGLSLALVLWTAMCCFFYLAWAKKKVWSTVEKKVYFLSNEQRYMWVSFLGVLVYAIILLVYISKFKN